MRTHDLKGVISVTCFTVCGDDEAADGIKLVDGGRLGRGRSKSSSKSSDTSSILGVRDEAMFIVRL